MKGKCAFRARRALARALPALAIQLIAAALVASAADRIQIRPQYNPGETLYYQIELHTDTTGRTTTPILNPEGGTKFSENVDLLVRLDVLPQTASGAMQSQHGAVQMRVTYERAHADAQSDAPEFDRPAGSEAYSRLAGHSFEFALGPGGVISNLQDPDNILPKLSQATAALSWMNMFSSIGGFSPRGISIGQKWTGEVPLAGAPLAGLVWQTDSTYLRNEPCQARATRAAERNAGSAAEQCAVILTQSTVIHRGPRHADETPPDYVRHGLRTAGALTGSGERLEAVSLSSGLLVSSTETSTQRADFDIVSAANGEKIHRDGEVRTQMVITRVAAPSGSSHR
ncbi:MAG: hypothetical protein KGL02_01145 [Acidobacteriota bacterium]|nr:hypothetical protein [Acidobacteriota bacterium]